MAKLYQFPDTQGSGQRVAVLEFGGGFEPSVLHEYFTGPIGLKTPPTVNFISVLGTRDQPHDPTTGEVYLDIEVIGAMAPQAAIDVYFAPWTGVGYLNAVDQAVQNDDYAAISISYGLDEDLKGTAANPGWPMLSQNIDEAFRDASAIGVPLFISSGDQGSSCLNTVLNENEVTLFSRLAHAAYPASSPYATACGGTMLYAEKGHISEEIVWNELGALIEDRYYLGGSTGGGVSHHYPVPSYQSQAKLNPSSINPPSLHGRGVPDVAGNAGASTGYIVSQPSGSPLSLAPVGGTSASAPMWAALMACVRQALSESFGGKIPQYFFNDFVYSNGTSGAFRDIVAGRNFTYDSQGAPVPGEFTEKGNNRSTKVDGYYAQKGYDLCTGWGSPIGTVFLAQLQSWLKAQGGR